MNKHTVRVGRNDVRVAEWLPEGATQGTIFIAPGWGESAGTFKRLAIELSQRGFRVITYDSLRKLDKELDHPYSRVAQGQKAHVIARIWRALKLKDLHVIAHSEGGVNAALAAHENPGHLKTLWLANSAGLLTRDSRLGLLWRVFVNVLVHLKHMFTEPGTLQHRVSFILRGLPYALRSPKLSLLEAQEAADADIIERVGELRKSGIKVYGFFTRQDHVFPHTRRTVLETGKHLDEIILRDGLHDDVHIKPQEFADLITAELSKT